MRGLGLGLGVYVDSPRGDGGLMFSGTAQAVDSATGSLTYSVSGTAQAVDSATGSMTFVLGMSAGATTLISYDGHLSTGSYAANKVQTTVTATGGSGSVAYSMQSNPSGGSVNSSTGVYTAGSGTGTDVVLATDAVGSTGTISITVRAFLFTDPGNLIALWDPSNAGSVTVVSGHVSQINDLSGSGDSNRNLRQASAGAQPAWNATDTAYGNLPTMQAPDAFRELDSGGNWSSAVPNPSELILVGECSTGRLMDTDNVGGRQVLLVNGTPDWEIYSGAFLISAVASNAPATLACVFGTSGAIYVNDSVTAKVTGSTSTNTANKITLFSNQGFGGGGVGKIAIAAIYGAVLSNAWRYEAMKAAGKPRGFTIT